MGKDISALVLVMLVGGALFVAAGCGYGGGEPSSVTTPSSSEGPSVQATIESFTLPDITVAVDATVTWTNEAGVSHTTTSGQGGEYDGIGWNSSSLDTGQSFSHAFNEVGTFSYTCRIHPSMSGTVTVTGSGETSVGASGSSSGGSDSGQSYDDAY